MCFYFQKIHLKLLQNLLLMFQKAFCELDNETCALQIISCLMDLRSDGFHHIGLIGKTGPLVYSPYVVCSQRYG